MAAPKGNHYWQMADPTKIGKPKVFKTPKELWDKACEYFKWCDEHPWIVIDAAKGGDRFGEHVEIPTARPYTISGLCIFLNCDEKTLYNYETAEGYQEFFPVTHAIKNVIYTQKFEGATVGAFNANIIARDLGLVDKQEVATTKFKVTRKPANDRD